MKKNKQDFGGLEKIGRKMALKFASKSREEGT